MLIRLGIFVLFHEREWKSWHLTVSKNYVMSHMIAPLVASGKSNMTIPEKTRIAYQKFVKP